MLKKYFYTMNRQCSTAKCEIIMTVFLIILKYLEVVVDFRNTVDIIAFGIVEIYGKFFIQER